MGTSEEVLIRLSLRVTFGNKDTIKEINMQEPILRIYITSKGVFKVDALIDDDNQRSHSYEFCQNVFGLIGDLDSRLRESVQIS